MALDTETREALIETVRRFVREKCVPVEAKVSEEDRVPESVIAEMRELGLFGLSIPTAFGGLGLTMEEEVLVCFELGQTSPAFRSVIGTNVGIGSQGVVMFGTEAQKNEWLPKLASGEVVASFALTEPGAGSDAASVRTTAIRDGDDYIVNGTKRYITNAPRAGMFTVMARSEPDVAGPGAITAFIVPAGTKGMSFGKPDKKMGQKGTITTDVIFEDAIVPAANIIGGVPGRGFKTAMKVLDRGRIHLSALASGMSQRLLEEQVRYASERQQFGEKIGSFQLVQALIADSRVDGYASKVMVSDVARRFDAGEKVSADVACTKYFTSEAVGRVADRTVQIFGGAGYMAEYKAERFYRDVRLLRIYEGTSQIQQIIIAKALLREAGLSL